MSAEESLFFIMRRKRQQREKCCFWKCHHATSVSLPVVCSHPARLMSFGGHSAPCQFCLQGNINFKENDRIPMGFKELWTKSLLHSPTPVYFISWFCLIVMVVHRCVCLCMCIYTYRWMFMCMHVYVSMYVCMLLCVCIRMFACCCVCLCRQVYMSLYVCMHLCWWLTWRALSE